MHSRSVTVLLLALMLASCEEKVKSSKPDSPEEGQKQVPKLKFEKVRLSMELVDRFRAIPLDFDDAAVREITKPWVPKDAPAKIGSMSVKRKARLLARLLDATDGDFSGTSLWNSVFGSEPRDLQFSCAVMVNTYEDLWYELLKSDASDVSAIAALALWKRHSRRYAKSVLHFFPDEKRTDPEGQPVRRFIERTLEADRIIQEIKKGDQEWGLWLAALRPHLKIVPTLLSVHKVKPTGYTTFALGSSGDGRVFDTLVKQLNSGDYMLSGYAAQALGLLGKHKAEKPILEVLDHLGPWSQAHACRALGRMGTPKALPYLKRQNTVCAINVHYIAQEAIKQIQERHGFQGDPKGE